MRSAPVLALLGFVVLSAVGTVTLTLPACVAQDEREARYFGARRAWESAVDATSATCGAGLLLRDPDRHYTPAGRCVLTGLGLAGLLIHLTATLALLRAAAPPDVPLPRTSVALLALFALQAASTAAFGALQWIAAEPDADPLRFVWLSAAAFASLGWARPSGAIETGVFVLASAIGAAGWPIWLLAVRAWRATLGAARQFGRLAGVYAVFLIAAGALLCAVETPRGGASPSNPASLAAQDWPARLVRCVAQSIAAAGAGTPTEALRDGAMSESGKLTLACVLFIGGFAGCAAGGVTWWAACCALRRTAPAADPRGAIWAGAAARMLLLCAMTVVLCAAGLLAIEGWFASRFQSPPTLGDALVDATSVVCGGALTTGVVETVCSRNLVRGIGLGVDQYQVGMVWIVAFLLVGRTLPLFVLRRAARDAALIPAAPATGA